MRCAQAVSYTHLDVYKRQVLALPILAVVMYLVYWIAMGPFGSFLTDWTNDVFAAEWLQGGAAALLEGLSLIHI